MAAINRTRQSHYNQKSHISVSTFEDIPYTALAGDGSIFCVIPPHSIILHLLVIEEEPTDANAKFSATVGGDTLINNGQLDANGLITAPQLTNIHREVSSDLIIKDGNIAPTTGLFTFSIMYIEHSKHNGEYTNFSEN